MAAKTLTKRATGKYERLFRERQERDLKHGPSRGLVFMPEMGGRVVQFIERFCKHHKGQWAGQPLVLEEWQKELLTIAFGWYRPDPERDGEFVRRFRTMYIEIGRKNGKSEIAGALGLYLLVGDGEEGAEVYASATKKDQAKIVWSTSAAMVKKSPGLKKFVKAFKSSLTVEKTESFFQPLSAESNTLDGLNPHGNIVDELHAHPDRSVWDVLDSAMGSRRQPMTVAITTAGVSNHESIGWEMHDYALKVLDRDFEDDWFFAFVAAPDEGDDHFSQVAQEKANPNLGVSLKLDYIQKQAEKAQRQPSFLNEYLVKHLNVWTQQAKRWLPMDKWRASEPECPPNVNARTLAVEREAKLKGMPCMAGLDLSSKLDLTALVLEFTQPNGVIELICRFWIPQARVEEMTKRGQHHYANWVRDGWLTATDGEAIDYDFIKNEIKELSKSYAIKEIAFDPWNALDLANRLSGDGFQMVECRQGYKSLSEPSKDIEAKVVQLQVKHMNNPVLRWCASNAVTTSDPAGNIKPDKAKATGKIDGIVAMAMARSRSINITPPEENPHDHPYTAERGFLSL